MARKFSKKYSAAERRAYWIGVGMNAERYGDSGRLLDCSNLKLRNSCRAGYNDENTKGIVENMARKMK